MNKHITDYRCSWCLRSFETMQGVRAHERAKHGHNMPVSEDDWQHIKLEQEHRRREGLSKHTCEPSNS